jgi:hypothetical protein
VAPSGTPEPTIDPVDPIIPAADPLEPEMDEEFNEPLAMFEPHAVDTVEPPPSKAALELVLGHGVCSGLKPGVLSSVAPSGIPPMPAGVEVEDVDGPEDREPSGEVEPMPVVGPVWAKAAPPPTDQMTAAKVTAKVKLYLIVSLRCFSARPTGFKTRMGRNWFPHCLGITVSALSAMERDSRARTLSLHGRFRCDGRTRSQSATALSLFAPM